MEVFEFADGDYATRQGNMKGTHFFIIESGTFNVIKDGEIKAEISQGQAFGESVILLSGAQTASVVAKGRTRAYGMKGKAVRKVLEEDYNDHHRDIADAVRKVLEEDY